MRPSNIAVATDPYSVAQDVASAVRTFVGECYYQTNLGIPYFQQILGQLPALAFVKAQICAAAATVPLVARIRSATFPGSLNRKVAGSGAVHR